MCIGLGNRREPGNKPSKDIKGIQLSLGQRPELSECSLVRRCISLLAENVFEIHWHIPAHISSNHGSKILIFNGDLDTVHDSPPSSCFVSCRVTSMLGSVYVLREKGRREPSLEMKSIQHDKQPPVSITVRQRICLDLQTD